MLNRHRYYWVLVLSLIIVLCVTFSLYYRHHQGRYIIPPRQGFVNDSANIFSGKTKKALEEDLREYRHDKGIEIIILVEDTILPCRDITSYASAVFRRWRIGKSEYGNGILFLLARMDKKVTIQFGHGLVGDMPPELTSRILTEVMVPFLERQDYSTGILHGLKAIIAYFEKVDVLHCESRFPASIVVTISIGFLLLLGTIWYVVLKRWRVTLRKSYDQLQGAGVSGGDDNDWGNISVHKHFIIICIIAGLALVFVTPPFQVADEPNHFYRAYQLSQGCLFPVKRDLQSGGQIPSSLSNTVTQITGDITYYPRRKQNLKVLWQAFSEPLDRDESIYMDFSPTAISSPVQYIPQTTGIAIGKLFDASPLLLMYLGRAFNLVAYAILVTIAIRMIPAGKHILLLLALMPMSIHLAASLSSDSLTNGLSFLLFALIMRCADERIGEIDRRLLWAIFGAAILLSLCKIIYFAIFCAYFIISPRKFPKTSGYYLFGGAVIAVGLILSIGWTAIASIYYVPFREGGFASVQEAYDAIISAPGRYAIMMVNNLLENGDFYLRSGIGILGHLDTAFPAVYYYGYALLVLSLSLLSGDRHISLTLRKKMVILATCICVIALLLTSQYWTWAIVRTELSPLQGRYFIPLFPMFAFIPYNRLLGPKYVNPRLLDRVIRWFVFVSLLLTMVVIIRRYYL